MLVHVMQTLRSQSYCMLSMCFQNFLQHHSLSVYGAACVKRRQIHVPQIADHLESSCLQVSRALTIVIARKALKNSLKLCRLVLCAVWLYLTGM